MHPFHVGREYPRRELLEFLGSRQQQAGVLWGERSPGCMIVTSGGRHGAKVGYFDERRTDGSWWYFGQGRSGDHVLTNGANRRLAAGRHTILLFTTREPTAQEVRERGNYQKLFCFEGMYNTCSHEARVAGQGARESDVLLRFLLTPVEGTAWDAIPDGKVPASLAALRERTLAAAQSDFPEVRFSIAQYRQRCKLVKQYAMARAAGRCEACGNPPPFVNDAGNGFLEVHHILRLADDGLDALENVAAVCPNCHRRAHYSADRVAFQAKLLADICAIEQALSASK